MVNTASIPHFSAGMNDNVAFGRHIDKETGVLLRGLETV